MPASRLTSQGCDAGRDLEEAADGRGGRGHAEEGHKGAPSRELLDQRVVPDGDNRFWGKRESKEGELQDPRVPLREPGPLGCHDDLEEGRRPAARRRSCWTASIPRWSEATRPTRLRAPRPEKGRPTPPRASVRAFRSAASVSRRVWSASKRTARIRSRCGYFARYVMRPRFKS